MPSAQGSTFRTPSLIQCSIVAFLKFLILCLNFCFESKGWWENEACSWTEEIHMENVTPFIHSVHVALWTWNSGERMRCRSSVTQSKIEHKVSGLCPWLSDSSEKSLCSFELELASNTKETQMTKKHRQTYLISVVPALTTYFRWK